jgi:hypothetical protein
MQTAAALACRPSCRYLRPPPSAPPAMRGRLPQGPRLSPSPGGRTDSAAADLVRAGCMRRLQCRHGPSRGAWTGGGRWGVSWSQTKPGSVRALPAGPTPSSGTTRPPASSRTPAKPAHATASRSHRPLDPPPRPGRIAAARDRRLLSLKKSSTESSSRGTGESGSPPHRSLPTPSGARLTPPRCRCRT